MFDKNQISILKEAVDKENAKTQEKLQKDLKEKRSLPQGQVHLSTDTIRQLISKTWTTWMIWVFQVSSLIHVVFSRTCTVVNSGP